MNTSDIDKKQIAQLKYRAHALTPAVSVGANGLTDNVITEVDRQLEHHELVKIGARINDREQFREMAQRCAIATHSTMIDVIGRRFVLYRKKKNDNNAQ